MCSVFVCEYPKKGTEIWKYVVFRYQQIDRVEPKELRVILQRENHLWVMLKNLGLNFCRLRGMFYAGQSIGELVLC